jgi:PiT family inorganic phosphate transporter
MFLIENFWNLDFFYGLDTSNLSGLGLFFFIFFIVLVAGFEFINGFHDTANAVATIIYTKTLKPFHAVLYSGTLNFLGVLLGGIAVAIGIIKLLPITELVLVPEYEKIALILALLLTAILWNLLTWYYGIPCSSSHTLIGAIIGVGIGFKYFNGGKGVNWDKAIEIGYSLLFSPIFGFSVAILFIFILINTLKMKSLFKEIDTSKKPPKGVRAILIATCGLVSFFHGQNDGQKGVGLILVILMTFIPSYFVLSPSVGDQKFINTLNSIEKTVQNNPNNALSFKLLSSEISELKSVKVNSSTSLEEKLELRKKISNLNDFLKKIEKNPNLIHKSEDKKSLKEAKSKIESYLNFSPAWTVFLISISLGIGTMIGYKRIVTTIGEKIGKTHLTYGQGAVSEIVAAITIGLSSKFGLSVSTTHVLSSAIAGSMVSTGGIKNLQRKTITNIALAWVLTLPVTVLVASLLYVMFRWMLM